MTSHGFTETEDNCCGFKRVNKISNISKSTKCNIILTGKWKMTTKESNSSLNRLYITEEILKYLH